MNKQQGTRNQRRKLLKSAALGSGAIGIGGLAGEKWAKPIISAVILPTHAQTTETDASSAGKTTTTTTTTT
ncbi:MAG: hypothetical protein V3V09_08305, partial [Arenicellales bacterium]